jgi:hypothetical protein
VEERAGGWSETHLTFRGDDDCRENRFGEVNRGRGEEGRVTGARRVADDVFGWSRSLEPRASRRNSTSSRTPLYQSSN